MYKSLRRSVLGGIGWAAVQGIAFANAPVLNVSSWPGTLPAGTQSRPQPVVVGYPFSYAVPTLYSVTSYSAAGLPPGITINASTGVVSGTPTSAGSYPVTLSAANSDGTGSASVTMTVDAAPTAAPVIDPIAALDVTYVGTPAPMSGIDTGQLLITAQNYPTSYGATNLPPKGAWIDPSGGFIAYNRNDLPPGRYTTTVSATNAVGTGTATLQWTVHPALSDGGVVPQASTYHDGDIIVLTATFTGNVVVTGSPYISLRGGTAKAFYAAGSGSSQLSFQYQTSAADGSYTDYVDPTIELNGGTIATSDGIAAKVTANEARDVGPAKYTVTATSTSSSTAAATSPSTTTPSGSAVVAPTLDQITPPSTATSSGTWAFGGTAAAGSYVQVTIIASPATGPLPGPLTNRPVTADGAGHWTQTVSQMTTPAGSYTFSAATVDGGGRAVAVSPNRDVMVSTQANGLSVPALTDVVVTGQVGTALAPVQIQATGSPTAFSAPELGAYGLTVSPAGQITGTPTMAITTSVDVTATNAAGASFPAKIQLSIAPAAAPTTDANSPTGAASSAAASVSAQTNGAASAPSPTSTASSGQAIAPAGVATDPAPVAANSDRLVNLSSRLGIAGADSARVAISGFVVSGTGPKQMLVRAVGPGLAAFGVNDALANPTLELFDSGGTPLAANSGWANDPSISAAATAVGAFAFQAGSQDAALLVTLAPGAYTAKVTSAGTGEVLIEVYDVGAGAAAASRLANISTRGSVGPGSDALVGGFVVTGNGPKRVLIRGIGPALTAFGVNGVLSDPMLTLHDASGAVIATNDDWGSTVAGAADVAAADAAAGAFGLTAGSHDSALVTTLAPGAYTAVVTGVGGAAGAALVEVYELPN